VKEKIDIDNLTADEQIKYFYGNKQPYCKVCGADTERVNEVDLAWFKTQDLNYKLNFIF
jgi:hypothetical protein